MPSLLTPTALRAPTRALLARPSPTLFLRKTYASKPPSREETKNAQPKILNENPPKEENASEDVRQHNADMARRADRPSEGVKQEDVEKDKVPKDFWRGSEGEVGKQGEGEGKKES